MKKLIAIASFLMFSQVYAQTWTTDEQYIQRFAKYAVEEMEKYKIPASITLAQGLLETGGGQSRLAQEGNNHFGIKCKKEWTGKTMRHTDDAPHECFRVYDSPRESYEDHSKFLAHRPYYKNLFKLDMKDYKGWAHGLKKAGYATNSRYAYILISKIEKYKLYEFDNVSSRNVDLLIAKLFPSNDETKVIVHVDNDKSHAVPKKTIYAEEKPVAKKPQTNYKSTSYNPTPNKTRATKVEAIVSKAELLSQINITKHPNRNVEYIVIPSNDITLLDISKKYGIRESRLLKWNDLFSRVLKKNQVLFLEPKNSRGVTDTYTVREGDTMYMISQKLAIKLKKLYRRNRMNPGQPIKVGQVLKLR